MKRRELLALSDSKLDSIVRIAGTNKDRRRVVTNDMIHRMNQMVNAGKSFTTIAEHFDVSTYTVKYNTNSDFRASEKVRIAASNKNNVNYGKNRTNVTERALYKRELVSSGTKLVLNN